MLDLSTIEANQLDQDRGAEIELMHPATGELSGLKLTLAGPDSATQKRAKVEMADALADLADPDGYVSAEVREKAAVQSLASCVIRWDVSLDGEPLACEHKHIVRLLSVPWVREQVDAFAGNRVAFMKGLA